VAAVVAVVITVVVVEGHPVATGGLVAVAGRLVAAEGAQLPLAAGIAKRRHGGLCLHHAGMPRLLQG
jgi:hypothetical protein